MTNPQGHEDKQSSDSTDAKVTYELIETLVDGTKGFSDAAEKVADDGNIATATAFREFSAQRSQFADELRTMAARYGDVIDSDGSTTAALHRGWISLKDALTGSSPEAVIKAASTGEKHAVSEYEKALDEEISIDLRTVVERQLAEIRAIATRVDAMAG